MIIYSKNSLIYYQILPTYIFKEMYGDQSENLHEELRPRGLKERS